jgi:hypothetical protein
VTRLRTAIACAVLASLAAACGSSTPASGVDPETALSEATEQTLAEESARYSYTWQGRPLPAPDEQGEVSFTDREARLSIDRDRYVYRADEYWAKTPAAAVMGKEWIHFDRSEFGVNLDDRIRLLPYLAAGATPSAEPEEDEIDGLKTTHYQANVDVAEALNAVPEADRRLTKNALEQELLGRTARVEFWVDADGRLRRVRVYVPPGRTYSRTDPNGDSISLKSGPATSISTLDYSEFGVEVDATPPPRDEVYDPTASD